MTEAYAADEQYEEPIRPVEAIPVAPAGLATTRELVSQRLYDDFLSLSAEHEVKLAAPQLTERRVIALLGHQAIRARALQFTEAVEPRAVFVVPEGVYTKKLDEHLGMIARTPGQRDSLLRKWLKIVYDFDKRPGVPEAHFGLLLQQTVEIGGYQRASDFLFDTLAAYGMSLDAYGRIQHQSRLIARLGMEHGRQ